MGRCCGLEGTGRKENDELYNLEEQRTWEKGCEWVGFVLGLIIIVRISPIDYLILCIC